MIIEHEMMIDCSGMLSSECSDEIVGLLGHSRDFSLRADTHTAIVHGSVTIAHASPPEVHQISMELYDQDEPPNRAHRTTLKRPDPMPTEAIIKERLNRYKKPKGFSA